MKIIVLAIFLLIGHSSLAQVEHNFEIGPEKTDCHKLPSIVELPLDSAVAIIRSAEYRFKQSISISKYRVPHAVSYYTCDGKIGYAIAQEDEKTVKIYTDMPKAIWNAFLEAKDPIGYYQTQAFKQYLLPEN